MAELKGKIVWLTGASSGIGEALAYRLASEGARLILSARREEELKRVGEKLKHIGTDYLILPLDLTDQTTFEAKKRQALAKFGKIDVLINNGGISQRSLAKDTPVEVDRKLFEVNVFGTIALTKAVLPLLVQQKEGIVVTITSGVGKFGSPWRSGYAATKHALHGFFDSLRAEIHADNVKVLLVCPGFIQTNVSINALTATGEKLGTMDERTARGLSADECARQIVSAIKADKEEVFISGFYEKLALYMKRFFPSVFSLMLRRMSVR